MIIFPAIDLRRGRCVRLRQGRVDAEVVFSDNPVAMASHWIEQGAAWLHMVNLDGALGQDSPNARIMAEVVAQTAVPVQFGGGLRDLETIEIALSLGPARVILGTAAVRNPHLVAEAIHRFGADSIVVGIDALDGLVATDGWQKVSSVSALDLARRMVDLGVARVVHTDIHRDGTLSGVNVDACVAMARATGLKVIASGGVSGPDDIRRLASAGEPLLEGVIVGQALYTGALTLPEAIRLAEPMRADDLPGPRAEEA